MRAIVAANLSRNRKSFVKHVLHHNLLIFKHCKSILNTIEEESESKVKSHMSHVLSGFWQFFIFPVLTNFD